MMIKWLKRAKTTPWRILFSETKLADFIETSKHDMKDFVDSLSSDEFPAILVYFKIAPDRRSMHFQAVSFDYISEKDLSPLRDLLNRCTVKVAKMLVDGSLLGGNQDD